MIISYQLFLLLLAPVFIWLSFKHYKNNKDNLYLWQRLGMKLPEAHHPIWFHCASVGEVITAAPLITLYKEQFPDKEILVTTNSVTGANVCRNKLSFATHCFLPLDYRLVTSRFLNKIKPEKLIILETELWPNLFQLCSSHNITITIINGRLSKRTTDINPWFKSIYKKSLSKVNKIYCRSDEDNKAYQSLGATEQQTETIGNLKFSGQLSNDSDLINIINRPYVIAASTHANEEKKIVELWNKSKHKDLLLVIAPRHPERKNEIVKDLHSLVHELSIRSEDQAITDKTNIYLADTFGELNSLFKYAEFVVMGGSFVKKGGHNILEPASYGKAILYGPSMENFAAENTLFLSKNASLQAHNDTETIKIINSLSSDLKHRKELGDNALRLMTKENNMSQRYLEILVKTP